MKKKNQIAEVNWIKLRNLGMYIQVKMSTEKQNKQEKDSTAAK